MAAKASGAELGEQVATIIDAQVSVCELACALKRLANSANYGS